MHYVYIIYSANADRFYVGETEDPDARLIYHNEGHQRYTRMASDWTMVFKAEFASRREALKVERLIKSSKSRKSIQRWITGESNFIK